MKANPGTPRVRSEQRGWIFVNIYKNLDLKSFTPNKDTEYCPRDFDVFSNVMASNTTNNKQHQHTAPTNTDKQQHNNTNQQNPTSITQHNNTNNREYKYQTNLLVISYLFFHLDLRRKQLTFGSRERNHRENKWLPFFQEHETHVRNNSENRSKKCGACVFLVSSDLNSNCCSFYIPTLIKVFFLKGTCKGLYEDFWKINKNMFNRKNRKNSSDLLRYRKGFLGDEQWQQAIFWWEGMLLC